MSNTRMSHHVQQNRVRGVDTNDLKNMPGKSQQYQHRQSNGNRQLQPLSSSQLANVQHNQDAQIARAKLNASKSFNIEDDLEFCPNSVDVRLKTTPRGIMNNVIPISPYNTPTKLSYTNSQRLGNFMSPRIMVSPQQRNGTSNQQLYVSPQGIRRLDLPNTSTYKSKGPFNNW